MMMRRALQSLLRSRAQGRVSAPLFARTPTPKGVLRLFARTPKGVLRHPARARNHTLRLALLLSIPWLVSAAPPQPIALIACAPGYPGTTAEAQGAMDSLASVLAQTAQWPAGSVRAIYFPGEAEGLARLDKPDAA